MEEKKKKIRKKTPSYILTLKLDIDASDKAILYKRFEICRKLYNSILGEGLKRFNVLKERKIYKKVRKELAEINKQYHNCKDENKLKIIEKTRKDKYKELTSLLNDFGINEYSLINTITNMYKPFNKNIDNKTAQALASRAWKALDKLIFKDAKKVYFKKYEELDSVEGKWNASGIAYRDGYIKWNGLKMPVIIKNNDLYAQKAIQDRVKYCRIKRELIKGNYHYYVQLVLEGKPPIKIKESGEIVGQRQVGNGKVGIDIGTSTIAYSSEYKVALKELAPSIQNIDRKIKLLQRKMDRSRRAVNPNKFNIDGTIKKGNKDKWIVSNKYKKIKLERKELYRKQKELRKQDHNVMINKLLVLGNEFYVEKMNYKGLQKRAKETTINEKTGKYNKKKRFGKSLANRAPSMFLTLLENKLNWYGLKLNRINTSKVKASQYNPITDEYVKKELKDRWNEFEYKGSTIKIQRDLMSAFIIQNVNKNLSTVNRKNCLTGFDNFKKLHDKEILLLKNSGIKYISSMGV